MAFFTGLDRCVGYQHDAEAVMVEIFSWVRGVSPWWKTGIKPQRSLWIKRENEKIMSILRPA
ncbi:MAG: hypothetical protein AMR96_05765 [Candidatus Adiutrix intracellularis]|nr:MAG: hypothetical protein AMR96_05765 [Candidatus Adiutrix intracellularis]